MRDPRDYNISLRQIGTSDEPLFEARVREFPDAIDYAEDREEAYELVIDTIEASLEVLQDRGKQPPEPVEPIDDYSGRITLRVPKALHCRLAEQAEHESISLNQYLVSLLAYHAGSRYATEGDHYQPLGREMPRTPESNGRTKQEIDQPLADDRGNWTP